MSISRTLSVQNKAEKLIPSVTQLLSKRPDRFSNGVWPAYFERAKGATIWDLDGNEYLDMSIGGIGATVLGYADPDVDAAVIQAIGKGVASSLNCPEEVQLAEELCRLHPWASMVRFSRCGGEAMAMAVRIARAATGKDVIAFCGYHGWHDWYLAANLGEGDSLNGHLMSGLEPVGVPRGLVGTAYPFQFNRLEELEKIVQAHGSDLAAIVMEPIRNEAPAPEFIAGVRRLADSVQAPLIIDEISAAFRYNTGGAHLVKHATAPDMAVFSKALGNGYAIAAVIGVERFMKPAESAFISSTNWTERVGYAAALATLRKHEANHVGDHLVRLGGLVQAGWKRLGQKHGLDIHVGGMEAMSHFGIDCDDFPAVKAYYVQLMLEQGILASNLCYLMFSHSDEDVDRYLAACDASFEKVAASLEQGDTRARLRGKPTMAGFARLA
jgi:glutamate-1-semialdehyde 2,1-aminomutase